MNKKLLFTCALCLFIFNAAAQAQETGAPSSSSQGNANTRGSQQSTRATHRRRRTSQRRTRPKSTHTRRPPRFLGPPIHPPSNVSELDEVGFKKLLQRDSVQVPRPLLVNFWATWCDPCREEFPDLVKIATDYRTRGLDIALISADDVAEIGTGVPKFLRAMHADALPVYLLNVNDAQSSIGAVDPDWGGELPATFLLDAHGQVVFKHRGRIDPVELRAALDKVVGDK